MNKSGQNKAALLVVCMMLFAVATSIAILSFTTGHPELVTPLFIAGAVCAMLPFILPFIQKINLGALGSIETKLEGAIVAATSALQDVDVYLGGRGNITAAEIEEKLETLNQRHLDLIYQYMDSWRTQQVFRIINIKGDEKMRLRMRQELSKLIPLLDSLIIIANGQDYDKHLHYYYSRLAYVYKDMEPRNWDKAYENIESAIACIDALKEKGSLTFTIYEFNRLIYAINKGHLSGKERDQMHKDFEAVIKDQSTAWMLAEGKTAEIIAPGLQKWLEGTKDYWERANPGKTRPAKKKWFFGNRRSADPSPGEQTISQD